MKVTLEEIKNRVADLDRHVKAELATILALITTLEGPQKPSPQRTLDVGLPLQPKEQPLVINVKQPFTKMQRDESYHAPYKKREENKKGICSVMQQFLEAELAELGEVPLMYACEALGTPRDHYNANYAMKQILKQDFTKYRYVSFNGWKRIDEDWIARHGGHRKYNGIMPTERADRLANLGELKILDAKIEKREQEEQEATTCHQK